MICEKRQYAHSASKTKEYTESELLEMLENQQTIQVREVSFTPARIAHLIFHLGHNPEDAESGRNYRGIIREIRQTRSLGQYKDKIESLYDRYLEFEKNSA
jgi:hypothetical protein